MVFDVNKLEWTREPASSSVTDEKIEIVTAPFTDLWQRTYYHFRNDNAPVLQMKTREQYFSFAVKTEFDSHHRFDHTRIVLTIYTSTGTGFSLPFVCSVFPTIRR